MNSSSLLALLASGAARAGEENPPVARDPFGLRELFSTKPAGREWLADRQRSWPREYQREFWIDVRPTARPAEYCGESAPSASWANS